MYIFREYIRKIYMQENNFFLNLNLIFNIIFNVIWIWIISNYFVPVIELQRYLQFLKVTVLPIAKRIRVDFWYGPQNLAMHVSPSRSEATTNIGRTAQHREQPLTSSATAKHRINDEHPRYADVKEKKEKIKEGRGELSAQR